MTTVATPTPKRQRQQQPRSCTLVRRTPGNPVAVLTMTVGQATTRFYLTEHQSDTEGRLFRLVKFREDRRGDGDDLYFVHVSDEEPACDCRGHQAHGHKTTCRHLACLKALIARGKL